MNAPADHGNISIAGRFSATGIPPADQAGSEFIFEPELGKSWAFPPVSECERNLIELVLFTFNTARERVVEADHVAALVLSG